MQPKVSIIIPAFNEEDYLPVTLKSLFTINYDIEVIIIDDGSTDSTGEVAKAFTNNLITLEKNMGKGEALMFGIEKAKGDIIVFLDADLQESARNFPKLIEPLISNEAIMTIAILPPTLHKGGFGLTKKLASIGISLLTNHKSLTPLSGQRAIKKDALKKVLPLASGFGVEVGLTIDILKRGYKIKEIPIDFFHRETKRDIKGFYHRGKQFKDIFKVLSKRCLK